MTSENTVQILAKSSSGGSYTVEFQLEEGGLSAHCSCAGGDYGRLCKHVKRLVKADESMLYDQGQRVLLERISSHLSQTTIPSLIAELDAAEELLKKAEGNAKRARKALEKALLQG